MNQAEALHPHAGTTAASRPWLARLHASLFGMVLGLLGLSGAWQRLARMEVGGAAPVPMMLLVLAVGLLALLLGLWAVKAARFPGVVRQEWSHPVQGAWALLEMRILNRLFAGPLPPALRPTLGIEMAPAAVGALTAATLWPGLPADVLMVMLGVASGPVLAVLTRWRYWAAVPFNVGFWSFAFPLAALSGAAVEAVRHGGWPVPVAMTAVALASAVVAFLAVMTPVLLARGRLLPPV